MIPSSSWFIIVNPNSGAGKSKRLWPKIDKQLHAKSVAFEVVFTEYHKHGTELVAQAITAGFRKFIAVGGDGTIHNLVNGIMLQTECRSSDVTLAVIPIGTGNDWIRTHGIPRNYKKAIDILLAENTITQDIGVIRFLHEADRPIYFNNLAGFGFDAFVVEKVGKLKRFGALAYLIAAVSGLFSFKPFELKLTIDDSTIKEKALLAVVGIGKYSGGGMRLTEYSGYNNGFFDFAIARNFSSWDLLLNVFRLFNGRIGRSQKVKQGVIVELTVEFPGHIIPLVQADGELIGQGDFQAKILRNALKLCK